MKRDFNTFLPLLTSISKDDRITVWHMAMVYAIVQIAIKSSLNEVVSISRKKVMELAHINSFMTYHKCIRELQEFGYILYQPSYHPALGSTVTFLKGTCV